jgi:hypothetical protein
MVNRIDGDHGTGDAQGLDMLKSLGDEASTHLVTRRRIKRCESKNMQLRGFFC